MTGKSATIPPGSTELVAYQRRSTTMGVFIMLLALLALSLLAGISVGSTSIAPVIVAKVLATKLLPYGWIDMQNVSEAESVVVWLIRAPRVLVAALVGAGL